MESTKEEVIESILYFAEKYGRKGAYEIIAKTAPIPTMIRIIVYDMFLKEFSKDSCSDEDYRYYSILLDYSTELEELGFVNYK